jgi:hypothetical protein
MSNMPSVPKAALWMGGWLSLMVVIAVAGREATRELAVFQIMEMRSIIGFAVSVVSYPDASFRKRTQRTQS